MSLGKEWIASTKMHFGYLSRNDELLRQQVANEVSSALEGEEIWLINEQPSRLTTIFSLKAAFQRSAERKVQMMMDPVVERFAGNVTLSHLAVTPFSDELERQLDVDEVGFWLSLSKNLGEAAVIPEINQLSVQNAQLIDLSKYPQANRPVNIHRLHGEAAVLPFAIPWIAKEAWTEELDEPQGATILQFPTQS